MERHPSFHIHLIWAQSRTGVIGRNGSIPWQLPEDLQHFKQLTLGSPVLMGHKTWDSLPPAVRPLPGRENVVLSRRKIWQKLHQGQQEPLLNRSGTYTSALFPGAEKPSTLRVVGSPEKALSIFAQQPVTLWVIGGGQVYRHALPIADKIFITEIKIDIGGDTFAPKLDAADWECAQESTLQSPWLTSRSGLEYRFLVYQPTEKLKASRIGGREAKAKGR